MNFFNRMTAWYLTQKRFTKRIVKRWQRDGKPYNGGNVHVLRYAYRAKMYWATRNIDKISQQNKRLIRLNTDQLSEFLEQNE